MPSIHAQLRNLLGPVFIAPSHAWALAVSNFTAKDMRSVEGPEATAATGIVDVRRCTPDARLLQKVLDALHPMAGVAYSTQECLPSIPLTSFHTFHLESTVGHVDRP